MSDIKGKRKNNKPWKAAVMAERRKRAEVVSAPRKGRTDAEQIAMLDAMFGEGLGATRERARLAKRMAKAS